jgi:hypothetical protein
MNPPDVHGNEMNITDCEAIGSRAIDGGLGMRNGIASCPYTGSACSIPVSINPINALGLR